MSSFVIDKKEYVKAAGLVAGIASVKRDKIFIFDYENGRRISTPEEWRTKFESMFEMNAMSVQEQYNDELFSDGGRYDAEFKMAYSAGVKAALGSGLTDRIMQLRNFFHCAIYQTEKDAYFFKMQMFFYALLDQLMQFIAPVPDGWERIDI